jgi:hypothetical protein
MKTAVEWLLDILVTENEVTLKGENYKLFEQAKEIEVNLAQQYAEFSILCDRRGMKIVKFKDWCKQYNEKTI